MSAGYFGEKLFSNRLRQILVRVDLRVDYRGLLLPIGADFLFLLVIDRGGSVRNWDDIFGRKTDLDPTGLLPIVEGHLEAAPQIELIVGVDTFPHLRDVEGVLVGVGLRSLVHLEGILAGETVLTLLMLSHFFVYFDFLAVFFLLLSLQFVFANGGGDI